MKEFAENLKRLRKKRGMSQNQLANRSGIPLATIRNYEQDRNGSAPTLYNLIVLADCFNVTPQFLQDGGENEMRYMRDLEAELTKLNFNEMKEIHDSNLTGTGLPKLSISDTFITRLAASWNKGVVPPNRGLYRSYIERTIIRYAQNRQFWKEKFALGG